MVFVEAEGKTNRFSTQLWVCMSAVSAKESPFLLSRELKNSGGHEALSGVGESLSSKTAALTTAIWCAPLGDHLMCCFFPMRTSAPAAILTERGSAWSPPERTVTATLSFLFRPLHRAACRSAVLPFQIISRSSFLCALGLSFASFRRFWAIAASVNSSCTPHGLRSRSRPRPRMRLRCANSISTFLRLA